MIPTKRAKIEGENHFATTAKTPTNAKAEPIPSKNLPIDKNVTFGLYPKNNAPREQTSVAIEIRALVPNLSYKSPEGICIAV